MKKLTKKQKKKYIGNPTYCPWCSGKSISWCLDSKYNNKQIKSSYICDTCKAVFIEVYSLSDVYGKVTT